MPRLPAAGSVTAMTTATSAERPEVMKHFVPLRTYRSPCRTARVFWLAASEPAWGSVRSMQAIASPLAIGRRNRSFCAGVP